MGNPRGLARVHHPLYRGFGWLLTTFSSTALSEMSCQFTALSGECASLQPVTRSLKPGLGRQRGNMRPRLTRAMTKLLVGAAPGALRLGLSVLLLLLLLPSCLLGQPQDRRK